MKNKNLEQGTPDFVTHHVGITFPDGKSENFEAHFLVSDEYYRLNKCSNEELDSDTYVEISQEKVIVCVMGDIFELDFLDFLEKAANIEITCEDDCCNTYEIVAICQHPSALMLSEIIEQIMTNGYFYTEEDFELEDLINR